MYRYCVGNFNLMPCSKQGVEVLVLGHTYITFSMSLAGGDIVFDDKILVRVGNLQITLWVLMRRKKS